MRTFKDLIEDVHDKGICIQCGGCVSFCNSIENKVIDFKDSNSPPVFFNEDKCLECGICYLICPQTHLLEDDLNAVHNFSDFSSMPLGFVDAIYSCQATEDDFLIHGTDGGVVNSVLNFLIEKEIIDGAIVAKTTAPFLRESTIARTKVDLIEASGVSLDFSPQLGEIQKFHTYTSSLPKLKQYKFRKLAVVGTPCQIYTIRCMQNLGIIPSGNIEICIGLFCYENFYFDGEKMRQFETDFNIKFDDVEKINIKEDLIIKLKDKDSGQRTVHVPFDKLNAYMRPACNSCVDFTNIYADISFGGLGSPDKFTTVITRTKMGSEIISKALRAGAIKRLKSDVPSNKKRKELLIQYSRAKIKRYKNFLKEKKVEIWNSTAPTSKLDIEKF